MKIKNDMLENLTLQYGLHQNSRAINKSNSIGTVIPEKVERGETVRVAKYSDNTIDSEDAEPALSSWEEAESLLSSISEDIAEEALFFRNSIHKPLNEQRVLALLGMS